MNQRRTFLAGLLSLGAFIPWPRRSVRREDWERMNALNQHLDTRCQELERKNRLLVVQHHVQILRIRERVEAIVETDGIDKGMIYLSDYSPTHYDDHENASKLGDALIELYELTEPLAIDSGLAKCRDAV